MDTATKAIRAVLACMVLSVAAPVALSEQESQQAAPVAEAAATAVPQVDPGRVREVALLMASLADRDARVRDRALIALRAYRPLTDAEFDRVARLLQDDPSEEVRRRVVEAQKWLGRPDRAPEVLSAALDDQDERVRSQVFEVLSECGVERAAALRIVTRGMESDHERTRSAAAWAASQHAPLTEAEVQWLAGWLSDESRSVRDSAAKTIVTAGPARGAAVSALAAAAQRTEAPTPNAAMALGRMVPPVAQAVPAVRRALAAPDAALRSEAARALGSFGEAAHPAIPDLIAALDDTSGEVVRHAAWALGDLGPPARAATPKLRGMLSDADARQAAAACYALYRIEGEAVQLMPVLVRALGERDPGKRRLAAYVLGVMGADAKQAVPALASTLENAVLHTGGLRTWYEYAWALSRMGPAAQDALPTMRLCLKKYPDDVALHAAVAAVEGNVDEHMPALLAGLKGDRYEWSRKMLAAAALGCLGPRAEAALPELEALCADRNGDVRLMAEHAARCVRGRPPDNLVDEVTWWLRR